MGTVATHNGSTFSREHNRRNRKITDKEEHIDKNGQFEVWADVDLKTAYHKLFDTAQAEYNDKQSRKDRQIADYYEKIKSDKQKNLAYEIIIGVYGSDSSEEQKKEILLDYAKSWKIRNPNLCMTGCYWHNDEEGEQHIHIDYIPCYHSSKGMSVQTGLNKALEEQGIPQGETMKETRQINWQRRENAYLTQLCEERGIQVEHPMSNKKDKIKHLETDIYKLEKRAEELKAKSSEVELLEKGAKYDSLYDKAVEIQHQRDKLRNNNTRLISEHKEMLGKWQKAESDKKKIEKAYLETKSFKGVELNEEYSKKLIDDICL